MPTRRSFLQTIAGIALFTQAPAHGEERGRLLLSEDLARAPAEVFTEGALANRTSGWKFFSGAWEYADGALRGGQRAGEQRGAQAVCVLPCGDAVFEFEVRLEGCQQVQFRLQDATPEHLCRVFVRHDGLAAQKDDHDHAGPDTATPFGRAPLAIRDGEWKAVRVELRGERLTATINGQTVSGSHALLAAPKHFFEFIVSGASASIRKLRVWETAESPAAPPHPTR